MKTYRFLGAALTLGLILFTALGQAQAQSGQTPQYTSYWLENIQWQTTRGGWADAQQGGFQVLGSEANSRGGFYHVRSLVNGCEWKFSWNFSEEGVPVDVTEISYSRGELAATFRIESSGGICHTNYNPFVEFRTDGDPTAPVYGPNEEYAGRFCLQAGGNCNQRSPDRKFKVYQQTNMEDQAFFEMNLFLPAYTGYGQHAQSIIYQYKGRSGDSMSGCFSADPGAGSTDRNAHYGWAQQQDATVLPGNLNYKLDLLFRCTAVNDDQWSSAFADISVIIARHAPNANCFNGDQGVISTDRLAHKNWAAAVGRQQSFSNLLWKTAAAFGCLDRSGQLAYFADVSVAIANAPFAGN